MSTMRREIFDAFFSEFLSRDFYQNVICEIRRL